MKIIVKNNPESLDHIRCSDCRVELSLCTPDIKSKHLTGYNDIKDALLAMHSTFYNQDAYLTHPDRYSYSCDIDSFTCPICLTSNILSCKISCDKPK